MAHGITKFFEVQILFQVVERSLHENCGAASRRNDWREIRKAGSCNDVIGLIFPPGSCGDLHINKVPSVPPLLLTAATPLREQAPNHPLIGQSVGMSSPRDEEAQTVESVVEENRSTDDEK